MTYKLTQYSHGAGCGCKIAPNILHEILASNMQQPDSDRLIVGNNTKDDAAVYDLRNGQALISTTDFFMPIVDDAFDFGRIASANAISDVYAMGGIPIMAIAILGWPINTLPTQLAARLIEGSRSICQEANIPLAGGHSIDAPEPIFGLAVNGLVDIKHIKQNNAARDGDILFLTKSLGIGILSTAAKKNILKENHSQLATAQMVKLNVIGCLLSSIDAVHAMTDVTGFGLLGHLWEMCEGSHLSATINYKSIPFICDELIDYIKAGAVPGGTIRNLKAYGQHIHFDSALDKEITEKLLADPQTSGGLLIAVQEDAASQIINLFNEQGLQNFIQPIGRLSKNKQAGINVLM